MPRPSSDKEYINTSIKVRKDLWAIIRGIAKKKGTFIYKVLESILVVVLKGGERKENSTQSAQVSEDA